MGISDFYIRVVKALDEIGAPYMIVGAYGGSVIGIARSTNDIDLLVDVQEKDCYAISERFPFPCYYADPEMIKNSIDMGIMFNLIDTEEGARADLVPLKREPAYQLAFNRGVKETFQSPTGEIFEAWVAQPTNIIIGKLRAWDEGRPDKHPKDISAILYFCLRGYSSYDVNLPIYWFFDFDCVVKQNLLLPEIEGTMLFRDALYIVIAKAEKITRRPTSKIPL